MSYVYWAALLVLIALYGAVLYRQLGGRGDVVPFLFLGAAVALVGLGVLSPYAAERSVNLPIMAFLFSMFVFSSSLDRAGAMSHVANWLASKARRPEDIVFLLFVGFGLMSTVIVNDALAVLMVPMLVHLSHRMGTRPLPLVLTLAYAVTVGSVLTPMGNPQNLLIALGTGMPSPMATYLRYLLVPVLVSLVAGGLLLRRWFRPMLMAPEATFQPMKSASFPLIPRGGWGERFRRHPSLWVFPATLVALLVLEVGHAVGTFPWFPDNGIAVVVSAGAAFLLLVKPSRTSVLSHVDWSTLLLFVGLFIVMAGEQSAGVVAALSSHFPVAAPGPGGTVTAADLGTILVSSLLGSQVFSNVPWVALSIPTMAGQGYGPSMSSAWLALAAGSTLAGNVTLLGAASNLIVGQQAQKAGIQLRLVDFARYGIPLTVLSVGVVFLCLLVGL